MRQVAVMLISILIAFLGSGCGGKQAECVPVYLPQKCPLLEREKPKPETRQFPESQMLEQSQQATRNYVGIDKFADQLQIDIDNCRK